MPTQRGIGVRATASFTIPIGLVNIPVSVIPFLDYRGISRKRICPYCSTENQGQGVKQIVMCPNCQKQLSIPECQYGYPISKDNIIPIPKEWDIPLETKIVSLIKTNSEYEYLTVKCYLLVPKDVEKPYFLLRDLLNEMGLSLVIEFVMKKKQHLGIVKPISINNQIILMLKEVLYAERIKVTNPLQEVTVSEEEKVMAKELFKVIAEKVKGINYLDIKDKRKEILEQILMGGMKIEKREEVKPTEQLLEQLKASVKQMVEKTTEEPKKKKVKVEKDV